MVTMASEDKLGVTAIPFYMVVQGVWFDGVVYLKIINSIFRKISNLKVFRTWHMLCNYYDFYLSTLIL